MYVGRKFHFHECAIRCIFHQNRKVKRKRIVRKRKSVKKLFAAEFGTNVDCFIFRSTTITISQIRTYFSVVKTLRKNVLQPYHIHDFQIDIDSSASKIEIPFFPRTHIRTWYLQNMCSSMLHLKFFLQGAFHLKVTSGECKKVPTLLHNVSIA